MSTFSDVVSGISGIGGIGVDIVDTVLESENNKKNYELQKEVFEYNKQQAEISRQREDSAVQRRAIDMQKAGINPLLAAGSAASTMAPIKLDAPQKVATQIPRQGVADLYKALISARQEIEVSTAQKELILQQARKASIDADTAQHDLDIFKRTGVTSNFSGAPAGQAGLQIVDKLKTNLKKISPAILYNDSSKVDWTQYTNKFTGKPVKKK